MNALQHGAHAAPIEVAVWGDGDDVVLRVENAGPPISPEIGEHLFEPFRRGPPDGNGLGSACSSSTRWRGRTAAA